MDMSASDTLFRGALIAAPCLSSTLLLQQQAQSGANNLAGAGEATRGNLPCNEGVNLWGEGYVSGFDV
jgi:hypothetical protein